MSPQLSIAALASALALVALCFQAPAISSGSASGFSAPLTAMADAGVPALRMPTLLPR